MGLPQVWHGKSRSAGVPRVPPPVGCCYETRTRTGTVLELAAEDGCATCLGAAVEVAIEALALRMMSGGGQQAASRHHAHEPVAMIDT